MEKLEKLKLSVASRNNEIDDYQFNIDNFIRAIEKIDTEYSDNSAIINFRENLCELLEDHKTEQLKSIIIRDVITDQINELEES